MKTAVEFSLLRLGAAVRMSSECRNDEDSGGILAASFRPASSFRRQSLLFPSLFTFADALKNGGVDFTATQVSSLPLCLPTPFSLGAITMGPPRWWQVRCVGVTGEAVTVHTRASVVVELASPSSSGS